MSQNPSSSKKRRKKPRARITTTRAARLWKRKRRREHDHAERLHIKVEQLEMAVALKETWEAQGNWMEVRRLIARIRMLRQELKYMNKGELP